MLTGLTIGNFKAFGEPQHIPIRPLTLIFGANSSGKSNVLHALLLMHHALQTRQWNVGRLRLGGSAVDLGGFAAYVHQRRLENSVQLGVEMARQPLAGASGWVAHDLGLGLSVQCGRDSAGDFGRRHPARLNELKVRAGMEDLLTVRHRQPAGFLPAVAPYLRDARADSLERFRAERMTSEYEIQDINTEHPLLPGAFRELDAGAGLVSAATADAIRALGEHIRAASTELGVDRDGLLPSRVVDQWFPHGSDPGSPGKGGVQRGALSAEVRRLLPALLSRVLQTAEQRLASLLGALAYLGPLRSFPPRWPVPGVEADPEWSAGGGFAWQLIARDGNLRARLNEWLGAKERLNTRYILDVRRLVCPREGRKVLADTLWDEMDSHPEWFGGPGADWEKLADSLIAALEENAVLERLDDVVLLDQNTQTPVNHRDIGVGISQVLPVLVHAFADQEQLVSIEQPELHLHPALQAELGDVFIESALGERRNTFLLETHSEHLILRIMRRMRETHENRLPAGIPGVRPEHVSVVFVEPGPNGSLAREMPLNPRGELIKSWPGGFFEEGFRELFA